MTPRDFFLISLHTTPHTKSRITDCWFSVAVVVSSWLYLEQNSLDRILSRCYQSGSRRSQFISPAHPWLNHPPSNAGYIATTADTSIRAGSPSCHSRFTLPNVDVCLACSRHDMVHFSWVVKPLPGLMCISIFCLCRPSHIPL